MTSDAREEERGVEIKVEARLIRLAFIVFGLVVLMVVVGLGSAGASVFWALLRSQETVKEFSAESRCRSDAAIVEAAALDDLIILLTDSSEGRPIATVDLKAAQDALRVARDAREDVRRNGCPSDLGEDAP